MTKKECYAHMIPLRKAKLTPLPWLEVLLKSEGLRGADGHDGPCGERGESGLNGSDGIDGIDGRNGLPGKRGQDGACGTDGNDGKHGLNGTDGEDGLDGNDGEAGAMGLAGKAGAKGAKGEQGRAPKHQVDTKGGRIRFERPDGGWGAWVQIKKEVKHEVHNSGGGGARVTQLVQDMEGVKSGTFLRQMQEQCRNDYAPSSRNLLQC